MSRVLTISLIPSVTDRVVSSATTESKSSGKRCFICAISLLSPAAASTALDPGNW